MYRRNQLSSENQIYSCPAMPMIPIHVGSLGRSNATGSSMPSSAGSEPPEASPERFRGREAGNRDAEELYERQITPKITDAENSFTVLQFSRSLKCGDTQEGDTTTFGLH